MMEDVRRRKFQYTVAFSASVATLTLGAISAWTSPVIHKFNKNETDFYVSKEDVSWVAAMNNPGFIAGSLVTRFITDSFGRRFTLMGSAIPFLAGTIIATFADNVWLLCVFRFLWGWGTGMVGTVIGIYIAEISDKDIRGRLTVSTKYMTNLGNLLMMGIGPIVSYSTLNYMLLALPICMFLFCWWIPESPYHYLRHGNVKLARRELSRLRSYKNIKEIEEELEAMQSSVSSEMRRSSSITELFTGKQYRRAIVIAVGIKLTSILTGGGAIKQYLGPIVTDSNAALQVSHFLLIYGVIEFTVSVFSSVIADKVGRRPLLLLSYLGTGLSLALSAIYFLLQEIIKVDPDNLSKYSYIVFIGIIMANVISAVGFNSISFAVIAEIFPINVKTYAMTSLSVLGGVAGFVVGKSFQYLKDISGLFGVFMIYVCVAFIGTMFVYFCVIETKGMSLNEIQVKLQGSLYNGDINKTAVSSELEPLENKEMNTLKREENKC